MAMIGMNAIVAVRNTASKCLRGQPLNLYRFRIRSDHSIMAIVAAVDASFQ